MTLLLGCIGHNYVTFVNTFFYVKLNWNLKHVILMLAAPLGMTIRCDIETLRCDVICSFPAYSMNCRACTLRQPMRFGKRMIENPTTPMPTEQMEEVFMNDDLDQKMNIPLYNKKELFFKISHLSDYKNSQTSDIMKRFINSFDYSYDQKANSNLKQTSPFINISDLDPNLYKIKRESVFEPLIVKTWNKMRENINRKRNNGAMASSGFALVSDNSRGQNGGNFDKTGRYVQKRIQTGNRKKDMILPSISRKRLKKQHSTLLSEGLNEKEAFSAVKEVLNEEEIPIKLSDYGCHDLFL